MLVGAHHEPVFGGAVSAAIRGGEPPPAPAGNIAAAAAINSAPYGDSLLFVAPNNAIRLALQALSLRLLRTRAVAKHHQLTNLLVVSNAIAGQDRSSGSSSTTARIFPASLL